MAQASSSWQQLINQLPKWVLTDINMGGIKGQNLRRHLQRNLRNLQGSGSLIGFLSVIIAMLLWNWKLLVASGAGISMMIWVYSIYQWDWEKNRHQIYQFFRSPHSRLTIAVTSGGISCVITYMAAAIWVESSSHWMATATILQGLGTLIILIFLVWQFTNFYSVREENDAEKLLYDLTSAEPIERLLAVRQLGKLLRRKRLETELQRNIADCLRLLLSQETETVIHQAAWEALQSVEQSYVLPPTQVTPFGVAHKVAAKIKQF